MADIEKQLPNSISSAEDVSHLVQLDGPTDAPNRSYHYDAAPRPFDAMVDPADPGEAKVADIRRSWRPLSKLRAAETWLDRKLGVEAMGVERIPEDKRRPPSVLNMMLFWFSLLFGPTMIPIGILGPTFGLSVHTAVLLTVLATLAGTGWPAFTATLSPLTGLRQIAVSRYAFGVWGSKLCGVLNVVVNVGYAVIACVLGGGLLRAVSDDALPLAVGIVVMALLGFAISFLGFRAIHLYERYAWVVAFALFCAVYAQAAPFFTPRPDFAAVEGLDHTGAALTYFAIVFGVCASWAPLAGDYYVHYPADVNRWLVFGLTYVGQAVPMIFVGVLGNYLGGALQAHPELAEAYARDQLGGLLLAVLHPSGWAKTACVFFFLSFLANVVANIYSGALCTQLYGRHFIAVPRSVWCLALTLVILALALGGRNALEAILNNLLAMLGYWTLAFGAILLLEHVAFRRRLGGYDLTAWQDRRRMPPGLAATGTLLAAIAVSFLGMNQTWFTAPAAKAIGAHGGDVGDYLVFAVTFVLYPILRTVEIRTFGR